jgi:hypothetical protein
VLRNRSALAVAEQTLTETIWLANAQAILKPYGRQAATMTQSDMLTGHGGEAVYKEFGGLD